jgi:hypothetical protein
MFHTPTDLIQHYQPLLPTMWESLLSQTTNRLAGTYTIKSLSGKVTLIDQISDLDFVPKTGRFGKTELDENKYARRAIYAQEWEKTMGFDEFDEIKLNNQSLPIAETMQKLRESYERLTEKTILDAMLGTAYEGENGATPIELPTSQVIPLNFVYSGAAANTGLTFDKFARLRRLAMENEAFGQGLNNGSDTLCIAVPASGIESLYHDVRVNNSDYLTAVSRVRDGEVDNFLGVKIIRTEQIPTRVVGGDTVRDCVAWVKSRVCYGLRNNYSVKMSVRDDLSEAIQIRAKFAHGATRTEEKGVWKMPIKVVA